MSKLRTKGKSVAGGIVAITNKIRQIASSKAGKGKGLGSKPPVPGASGGGGVFTCMYDLISYMSTNPSIVLEIEGESKNFTMAELFSKANIQLAMPDRSYEGLDAELVDLMDNLDKEYIGIDTLLAVINMMTPINWEVVLSNVGLPAEPRYTQDDMVTMRNELHGMIDQFDFDVPEVLVRYFVESNIDIVKFMNFLYEFKLNGSGGAEDIN